MHRKRLFIIPTELPHTGRFLTLRVHGDFPNPSGFPLGMTVVEVVVALSTVISTKKSANA